MNPVRSSRRVALAIVICGLFGCETAEQNLAGGAALATLYAARTPAHELQQVYYVGVFDPTDQLPPALYRLTVHGQSSLISNVKFASGWVPAPLIDSLGSSIAFNQESGRVEIQGAGAENQVELQTGRRLMMFGPEGFREAPKGHRLVVVMGSDPSAYFEALDKTLGKVSTASAASSASVAQQNQRVLSALVESMEEREKVEGMLATLPAVEEGS